MGALCYHKILDTALTDRAVWKRIRGSAADRQGLTTMTSSRFNGRRMEDSWLDKQLPQ